MSGSPRRNRASRPEDTDLQLDLGSALLEAGSTDLAREQFDRVLAAEPDRATAQLFSGIAVLIQLRARAIGCTADAVEEGLKKCRTCRRIAIVHLLRLDKE